MSSLIVEVCAIQALGPHPNADRLELAQIKGWQCVVPKGRYSVGQLVTYIPVDSVVPLEISDRFGFTQYLSHGRVRCAKLRGEPSFGVIVDREDGSWEAGKDLREHYGITKYLPPLRLSAGDAETPHPLFVSYTDIENLRNFPEILAQGEPVSITEKIHGTNVRVGIIEGETMAGSMEIRRKRPAPEKMGTSTYWFPATYPGVQKLLETLSQRHRQVVLFGEIYGSKIQSLSYGKVGELGFAAFDLLVDGRYVDPGELVAMCQQHEIPQVPILHEGPFELETVRRLSQGKTTLGANHIREGIVIRPVSERTHPKLGRVILKLISDDYLLDKSISDAHDV